MNCFSSRKDITPPASPLDKLPRIKIAPKVKDPVVPPSPLSFSFVAPPPPLAPLPPTISQKYLHDYKLHPDFEAKYTLGDELGSGGFGFVVSAFRKKDVGEVAVKFILRQKVPSYAWTRDRVLGVVPLEVYILRHLKHPNIIRFLECYQDSQFFYLVMEMHGSQWIKKTKPPLRRRASHDLFECIETQRLNETMARYVFHQIASAVGYLHSKGVVHRDIKDENVVVDKYYNVKLIDFGSAAAIPTDKSRYFDRFFGTIQYASPEILRGESYRGPEAEVWALGVLLYTMLFGQVAFSSPRQACTQPFTPPRVRTSNESMDLLEKMLDKDINGRATISRVLKHPWFEPKQ